MKKLIFILIFILSLFIMKINMSAYSYGVGKCENGKRPDIGPYKDIIESNGGHYIGKDQKELYLTFDCGYENGYTNTILDTLKETNTPSAFFITGHYLLNNQDIVKRMISEGHLVCNHTYNHNHFTKENETQMLIDVKKLEDKFYEIFQLRMEKFVRPPAGEFTVNSLKALKDNGYTSIFWSLAYVDWYKDKYYQNDYSYNNVMKKLHNGAIILMHSVSKDNALDLPKIIEKLTSDGYEFKSIKNL